MEDIFKEWSEALKKQVKTKKELWQELDGKTVKCVYTKDTGSTDDDCHMFALYDLESEKIYVLDTCR